MDLHWIDLPPFHPDLPPFHPDLPPLHPDLSPLHPNLPPLHPNLPPLHPDLPPLHPDLPSLHPGLPPLHPGPCGRSGTLSNNSHCPHDLLLVKKTHNVVWVDPAIEFTKYKLTCAHMCISIGAATCATGFAPGNGMGSLHFRPTCKYQRSFPSLQSPLQ